MDYAALTAANSEAATAAEMRGDAIVNAWPMRFTLELTADCNLHCFMCDCEMHRNKGRAVGIKKFALPEKNFHEIAAAAFPRMQQVNPTVVGEPFVLAYFEELLEACAKYHVKLDIITNGMLMRGPRLRQMMPHIAEIRISFDGGTKPTFDHIRTGAKFEKVMANLDELAALRRELGLRRSVRTMFNVTILRENVDELARIVEIAAEKDIDSVQMSYLLVFLEELRSSSPFLDPVRTNRGLRKAQRRAAELGVELRLPAMLPTAEPDPELEPELPVRARPALQDEYVAPGEESPRWMNASMPPGWKGKFYCRFPWKEVFVSQSGDVAPCCGQGRPVMGNAFTGDFEAIWNGPEYQRLRQGLYDGNPTDYCRDCPFLQVSGAMPFRAETHFRISDGSTEHSAKCS
jgi:MoaA/NifB/PqqE/SkfB family radical SAM enzyme